jgi:hypothetical protein
MKSAVEFNLAGRPVSLDVEDQRLMLRAEPGLTGGDYGCGDTIRSGL